MKHIMSACLEQTHKFETEQDYQVYIDGLNRKRVKYKIVETQTQPSGQVIVKIKK